MVNSEPWSSKPLTRSATALLALCCTMLVSGPVAGQSYPAKPIRIIVASAPGGGPDLAARLVGQKLSEALGQPVVVDNRAGAGGVIGAEVAARSPVDGYTLFLGNPATLTINPSLQPKLPYDAVRDFAPVTLINSTPFLLVIHPSLPASSVKQLIALARAKPGKLNFASAGSGSVTHLAGELFKSIARVDIVHVPYKASAAATNDVIGGQIEMVINAMTTVLPHVKSGKLKALAVATESRAAALPELPTMIEAGVPDYVVTTWNGLLVPAGTPPEIISRLHTETVRVIRLPEIQEKLRGLGSEPIGNSPEQFAAFLRKETVLWARAVKASGARPD